MVFFFLYVTENNKSNEIFVELFNFSLFVFTYDSKPTGDGTSIHKKKKKIDL